MESLLFSTLVIIIIVLSTKKILLFNTFFLLFADIDECMGPELNECDLNAMCTNTEGSYVCRCKKNFEGDGRNCTGKTDILTSLSPMLIVMSKFKSLWSKRYVSEKHGLPRCVCSFGYQGDGYNCTGSREWQSLAFLLFFTLPFNDQPDEHISPLSQNAHKCLHLKTNSKANN